jgi:putative ABC transport system permease protein
MIMGNLWQDLRYSARTLLKRPGFTVVALITLALGLGANTAIFTVVDAALLRPLAYKEPERLVHLWETRVAREFSMSEASYPNYLDWKSNNNVFADMGGYQRRSISLTGREVAEQLQGARATASFFTTLGVEPLLGRTFTPEEDAQGVAPTAILSYGLWQRRFGGDPDIVGQSLTLNGINHTVVGVLPKHFQFAPAGPGEIWLSLNPSAGNLSQRSSHWFYPVARLGDGVTFEQARAEMDRIAQQLEQQYADANTGSGIKLVLLPDQIVGPIRPALIALLLTVGCVLLIACANVANLLLARAAGRQKEIAVRLALGASRWRLVRQMLTESTVLAIIGGVLGLALAKWGVYLLVNGVPESQRGQMPYLNELSIDGRIFLFTFSVSLLTGVIFGLAPALQASKAQLTEALKEGGRSSSGTVRRRVRDGLVVAEIALALVLLVGAGLMTRSVFSLLQSNTGFASENLLTMQVAIPPAKYGEPEKREAFHRQLIARIESLPGVTGASTTSKLPLIGGTTAGFLVEGRPEPAPGEVPEANVRNVSHNYLRVMGASLIKGRYFTEQDNSTTPPVLIINQSLADRFFPNEDPVGKRVYYGGPQAPRWEIIGVIADMQEAAMDAKTTSVIYFPYLQRSGTTTPTLMTLAIRTSSDPASIIGTVRGEIASLEPDAPVFAVQTMEELITNTPATFLRRYPAFLIGGFALLALLLAVIGIYGVISYTVTQRSHEIGIRVALGAKKSNIYLMVLGQGLTLSIAGVVTGLVASFALTSFLSSLLFGVTATDPFTLSAMSFVLIIVALAACYIPARRAARVDPMVALRYE